MKLVARGKTIEFPRRPLLMGIVNLCADSFSGDGLPDPDAALAHARQLVGDGADLIDVGAESAGTQRGPINESDEADRLLAFVRRFQAEAGEWPRADDTQLAPLLSINTWRPAVARAVLAEGGDLLNDIGGLSTDENARICAEAEAALLIMHTVGEPKVPHTHVTYPDVVAAVEQFFTEKLALAEAAGLSRDAIVLDPGIDFAKQCEDNLTLLRELKRFHGFERPLLLPISRKTVIGDVLDLPPADRDTGTIACLVSGLIRGAQIYRVHNVRAARLALLTSTAVLNVKRAEPTNVFGI